MRNSILENALLYSSNGVPVLPLHGVSRNKSCTCGRPIGKCKPGKHPVGSLAPHGVSDATVDSNLVSRWFGGVGLNIGIATGSRAGFFVLDRDDSAGGQESLRALIRQYGPIPKTLEQKTGAGRHYFFRMPSDVDIKNSQRALGPGLDIRGSGGYVVAPPSTHQSGATYEWESGGVFDRTQIAEAPAWLLKLITERADRDNKIEKEFSNTSRHSFSVPERISDGEGRESFLLRYASHLRSKGMDQEGIERILLDYNNLHITPPVEVPIVLERARRYQETQEWAAPKDLTDPLPPVPTFDTRLLPKPISAYVQDVAERMNCPVEFPAVAALVVISSAIGGKVHCKPYEKNTWTVPGGLWGLIVSPPSSMKTPPLTEMLLPLRDLDRAAIKDYEEGVRQFAIDQALYDSAVKKAVKNGQRSVEMEAPCEPGMRRYIVNDCTYEKLIEIARFNPNGFLVYRDELIGWFHSLSKENQKEARSLYLTGWNGTDGYATDRIGRGHVRADVVNLSLIGTIQPSVLRGITYDAVTGGAGDDGLIARFQMSVYPDPPPPYKKVDRAPDFDAMQSYHDLIKRLAQGSAAELGAEMEVGRSPFLRFDSEAQEVFDKWRQRLEERLRDPGGAEHPAILAHLGKYRSLFPKIALTLHLSGGDSGPISQKSAVRAKIWTELLEAHARRVYHTATNRVMASASALANKLRSGVLASGFTRSDVLTKDWAGLRTADELASAITVLVDANWLRLAEDRRTGGRPSERYLLNPGVPVAKR